ncbi:MAG: HAMP domain-containing sensor histidine kinase [Dermatophilaceae bacterium]
MRQRVIRVAVVAVAVALLLFAVPLAITIQSEFFTQERDELESTALEASLRVGPQFASGEEVKLPVPEADKLVGVYDLAMQLRVGRGPSEADPLTRRAVNGVIANGQVGSDLVVAIPVSSSEKVVGVARASVPVGVVWRRVILAWLVLVALAGGSLIAAILVARRQARLLTEPLEALSAASQRVADGDFIARAELSAIPEIHRVAETQNAMVGRLTQMIEKERHFSANASHQLRTPITGLQLGLEAALQNPSADLASVLSDATRRVRELHGIVDEVLALARLGPDEWLIGAPLPLGQLMAEVESRWYDTLAGHGRPLLVNVEPEATTIEVPGTLVIQILNVLIDNAVRHGRGSVTLTARETSETLAVDVADEGTIAMDSAAVFNRGTSGGKGQGIGLALARSMAEARGGRLLLSGRSPATFTLFLPGGTVEASEVRDP